MTSCLLQECGSAQAKSSLQPDLKRFSPGGLDQSFSPGRGTSAGPAVPTRDKSLGSREGAGCGRAGIDFGEQLGALKMGWELLPVTMFDHPTGPAMHTNPPVPTAGTKSPAAGRAAWTRLLPKHRQENHKHRGHPALPLVTPFLTTWLPGWAWETLVAGTEDRQKRPHNQS